MRAGCGMRAAGCAAAKRALTAVGGIAVVMAAGCSKSSGSSAVDLTKPPELAPPPSLELPPVATRELPNGLTLVVVEHHELPIADVQLVIRTGGEADPSGRAGLATLTADMLDEGTTTRSALQIADQKAYLGARLGTGSGWDASVLSLHVPTAQLDSALTLFADVALHPAFAEADLDRLRTERLTDLIQLKDRPPLIANRAYEAILYGDHSAYGHPLEGDERSTAAITRADVQRFYDRYYRPNNATLIVVGDLDPDEVEQRARALFGGWAAQRVAETTVDDPAALKRTTIYLIDKPGAPQSSIRIGAVGVLRATPDYFPILVMNTILGGAFTSRLNQNLRETHGYTYGAGSSFAMRRAAGPFTARAEVVASKTDSSLLEFMRELRAIHDTVPVAELRKAKRYLELQLPARFETTGGIANQLVPLVLYGLPLDFYDSYVQHIEAVTRQDVQRVADRYIDPDRLAVVVVGDRDRIEAGIRKTRIGPISVRDLTGAPIRP